MKFDKKYITTRFPYIVGVVILVCIGVIWKMVKIMTVDKEEIIEYKKENVDGREVEDPAKRGNILSDNGELMSTSLPEYNVTFDFIPGAPRLKAKDKERNPQKYLKDSLEREKYIAKKDSIFRANVDSISIGVAELCPEMGGPDSIKAHMLRGLEKRSQDYDMFKHHAFDYISYQKLRQLPIFRIKEQYKSGVIPTARNHREKPFGDLASRTIGDLYARKDSAEAGIELAFDSVLRGVPGKKRTSLIRSKSNFVDQPIEPPVDGLDVVTTINVTMQDICESALREKLIEVNADFGVCILMDVHTGDIKALVNLRRRADGTYNDDQNLAVSALMEPGSTFKTASILVALDDGELTINDQIDTGGGQWQMYGRTMRDDGGRGHGRIDVKAAVRYSSNIGVSRIIDNHYHNNPQRFVDGLKRVGIGQPLGFCIPGTANPRIYGPEENKKYWSAVSLPWMAIGYNTQIPPISTVTFYNAIANNGCMVRPRIVSALSKNGEIVEKFPVEVIKDHICSDTALHAIQEILKDVVNGHRGTGRRVKSKYFYVSGKTGTAQVADEHGGYHSGQSRHFVSFCGYYPSDNPQYTCLVAIKTAHSPVSGGATAGTVFLKIAEQVYSKHVTTNIKLASDTIHTPLPEIKAGNMNAAQNVLSLLGLKMTAGGDLTSIWGKASNATGMMVAEKQRQDLNLVPDVIGMGARDAAYALELRGLKPVVKGYGKVVEQSTKPGEKAKPGQKVVIKLEV